MQDTQQLWPWFKLAHTPGLGNATARQLLLRLRSPQAAMTARSSELKGLLSDAQMQAWLHPEDDLLALFERTCAWLDESTAHVRHCCIALDDPLYPQPLLHLPDPPLLLHALMGSQLLCHSPARIQQQWQTRTLAMVGSRNATPQGMQNARRFAQELAAAGWSVVSGMASGIDAAAHAGALLSAAFMPTMAMVGTGLDRVYPRQNRALCEQIAHTGCVFSEYPLGTPPLARHFPRRNRLIAALSRGTLVVEAAPESGSLITAAIAAELGRDVFAIPGSIHQTGSKGCHRLLRQGAILVEEIQDILQEYPDAPGHRAHAANELGAQDHEQSAAHPLLDFVGVDPISVEAICAAVGRPAQEVQSELLALELDRQIACLPGGLVQRLHA